MSTSIEQIPLLIVQAGCGPDEDVYIALPPYFLPDGVTPISLAGITFSCLIVDPVAQTTIANPTTGNGGVIVSGSSLTIFVAASATAAWAIERYNLTVTAIDGTYTKDLFSDSFLSFGSPASLSVTPAYPAPPPS